MALELGTGSISERGHICRIPPPFDPEVPEGHLCECGKRWSYQPAHWELQLTLEELVRRQQVAAFLHGIIPRFQPEPGPPAGERGTIVPIGRPAIVGRPDRRL
jgi:hypothetical protein